MKTLLHGAMSKYCYNIYTYTFQCRKKNKTLVWKTMSFHFFYFHIFCVYEKLFYMYFLKITDSIYVHFLLKFNFLFLIFLTLPAPSSNIRQPKINTKQKYFSIFYEHEECQILEIQLCGPSFLGLKIYRTLEIHCEYRKSSSQVFQIVFVA